MPRTLSLALAAHLQGAALSLANCVRLTTRAGRVLGFTSLDAPLTIAGTLYEPQGGIASTSLKQGADTGVDTLDLFGLLTSDKITEADIAAGAYDGAEALFFQMNWQDLSQGTLALLRAHLGEVTLRDGQYVAELRSLTQQLKQYVGDITSAACRVKRLGDAQCKVNVAAYRFPRTVSAVVSLKTLTFGGDSQPGGYYDYGIVWMTSGANAGQAREVKTHTNAGGAAQVVLRSGFPYPVSVGDAATLEAGCDRLFGTCKTKFRDPDPSVPASRGNTNNFRGEPHIPGNDQIIWTARK